MSKKKRDLTSEERKLWRRVAEGVKARKPLPLAPDEEVEPPVVVALSRSARRTSEERALPRRPPSPGPLADRGGEKRIRRGRVEPTATLDLHGHTLATARSALARFLSGAQRRGDRTVIVVTGVGRGGEGVLKRALPQWLAEREIRTLIAGFAQAHRSHGGAGAFYVFLKRGEAGD